MGSSYLLKIIWKQVVVRGFIFTALLSLQIAIMGTLVFRIKALRAPTPPLSPDDIPSTSSMMMTDLVLIEGSASSPYFSNRMKVISKNNYRKKNSQQLTAAVLLKKPERVVLLIVVAKAVYVKKKRKRVSQMNRFLSIETCYLLLTSSNFLLRTSLAFNSKILNPCNFATK